ncbi:hypothetical protein Tco_0638347 [Tanacetum coccineum]
MKISSAAVMFALLPDTLDYIWNGQSCKKIEVKFSIPGRGLTVLDSGLHDSLDSGKLLRDTSICCMGAYWKEQLCLGSSKEAKESNLLELSYSFQLDETRFVFDANLLREALEITPIDQAHQFVSPPSGDAIMDFVNELGYTKEIHFVSRMAVNNLYQPWRAILSMINQCLTGKTSGFDRPRYPVFQMLWGIITSTNVDYVELMWEEFVQAIQTFLTNKANLGSPTKKGRKDKPHVIPYCRFTKLIICHLERKHNMHQRYESPLHLAKEDPHLGNLKFVLKGEKDEVFAMQIPNVLITDSIRNAPYYEVYLGMVAKHDRNIAAEKEGKKKSISKVDPSKKPTTMNSLQLIDEDKPSQPEPEPEHQGEGEEYDVERAIQMSLESFQAQGQAHVGGVAIREPVAEATRPLPVVEGKGKAIATEEQAAQSLLALHTPKKKSTTDQFIF